MKRNSSDLFWLLCLFITLTIQGCAGMSSSMAPYEKMASADEMYMATVEENPEVLSGVVLPVDFKWNIASTARFPYRLPNSTTWRFVVIPTDAIDTRDAEIYYAVKFQKGNHPFLFGFLPGGLKKFEGKSGFLLSNNGDRIMGANGLVIELPKGDWRKIDPSEYKDCILPISRMKGVEAWRDVESDKGLYRSVQSFVKAYTHDVDTKLSLVEKIINKRAAELGFPTRTMLNKKQLAVLRDDKSLKEQLWVLLTDNWDIMFTYPLMSMKAMGATVILSKVFHVSSALFGDDLDRQGSMDNKDISMLDVAAALEQYHIEYNLSNNEQAFVRMLLQSYKKNPEAFEKAMGLN